MTEKRIFPARPFNDCTPTPAKRRQISSFSSNRCGRPFQNTGNNYFGTVYGVLTKSFSIAGRDRLALTAGYYIPINDRSIQKGPFGGISYSPAFYREMAFMAEYDSDGFNIGAATRLWRHISLHIFTRDFKCVSGGIRYECKLLH